MEVTPMLPSTQNPPSTLLFTVGPPTQPGAQTSLSPGQSPTVLGLSPDIEISTSMMVMTQTFTFTAVLPTPVKNSNPTSPPRPGAKLTLILPAVFLLLFLSSLLAYMAFRRYRHKLRSKRSVTIPTPFNMSAPLSHRSTILTAGMMCGGHLSSKRRVVFGGNHDEPLVHVQDQMVEGDYGGRSAGEEIVPASASEPASTDLASDGSGPAMRAEILDLRARLADIEAQISPPDYSLENGR